MFKATATVLTMIQELRKGVRLEAIKRQNDHLQRTRPYISASTQHPKAMSR
jgi:hypothetical protein